MNKIEGIPDGWELVRIGQGKTGDYRLSYGGEIMKCDSEWSNTNNVIIRQVKPKTYRPFANAAEFEPHRNRWLMHPSEPDKRFKPGDYNNEGVWGLDRRKYSFADLFESGTQFDDGTPFGVEVSE